MRIKDFGIILSAFILFLASCSKDNASKPVVPPVNPSSAFPEKFESGTKTDYAAADVTLATGSWKLEDAVIGTSSQDRKNGTASIRMQNNGMLTMNFNVSTGASVVSLYYASYGTDPASSFELWASVNGGLNWIKTAGPISVSTTTLTKISIGMNFYGNVRIQIRKIGGGQINIDDINILGNSSVPTKDDNMALGNPDNAISNISSPDKYLIQKSQYSLSYNSTRGISNWVSWHLSTAWKGVAPRCNCFTPDTEIPTGFYQAQTFHYTSSGFDRGHLCPSEDRDLNDEDNAATFIMSNIIPQAPNLNQIPWSNLENYCRTLINLGNELYIIAGGYGTGGTGTSGGVTDVLPGSQVTVPARCWKVIVVLPVGSNDAMRVSNTTRVIAVDMPNTQASSSQQWGSYRVSVAALQSILGYDLLSNVPADVQAVIEANVDNGPTQ